MTNKRNEEQTGLRWQRTLGAGVLFALVATGCGEVPDEGQMEGEEEASETLEQQAGGGLFGGGRLGGGGIFGGLRPGAAPGATTPTFPSSTPSAPSTPPASTGGGGGNLSQWCQVKQVMSKNCIACHDGKGTGGSPMGLTTHDDFMADAPISQGKKVYEAVGARMHDAARPMPPRGVLPASELAKVDAWIAAGAPVGPDEACTELPDNTTQPTWPPADCDEIYELRAHGGSPNTPYRVPAGETHPQIRIDAPWGNERVQAIAFKPLTDNGQVLHHWILFAGMSFLTGWAPGDDLEAPYPPHVGMDMPTGRGSMRLDMHYYNTGGAAQDRSGTAVCVVKGSKLRPNPAAVAMNFSVFGPVLAPANNRNYEAKSSCRFTGSRPVTLLTASPHAHKYAKHMKFTVRKANGREIVMHDGPFRFGEQGTYPLDPPVVLENGDTVNTSCFFDNPTNRNVTFGESTEDEMCFNFAVYYPKGALACGGLGGLGGLFGGGGGLFGR